MDDYEGVLLNGTRDFISCILLHCDMRHSAGHSVGNCYRELSRLSHSKQTSTHCTIMLAPSLSLRTILLPTSLAAFLQFSSDA